MPSASLRFAIVASLCATAAGAIRQSPAANLRKLQENPQVPIGFQSGPDPGATYGGSIVYRPDTHRIYITGASYGNFFKSADDPANGQATDQPSCFLGIAELPPASEVGSTPLTWVHTQQWEANHDVPEACNAMYVDRNPYNLPENNTSIEEKLYLLGMTSVGGLMEPLRIESTFPAEQYGMIMDVDIVQMTQGATNSPDFTTNFWGGRLLQDGPVQYPIDLTVDDEGNIYVVSLQTFDGHQTSRTSSRPDQVAKQMVDPWMKPFGTEYNMLIEQFLYDNPGYDDGIGLPEDPDNVAIDTTIVDNWRKPYGPTSGGGALVAGIEFMGGLLVVVGSTNGHSEAFGNEVSSNSNHTDRSFDVFVTKIIPDSGTYYQFVVDNGAPHDAAHPEPLHKRSSSSFMSIDFKDDFVMGMCTSPADPDHFYLVGTTEGQMDRTMNQLVEGEVHAFLMKIDLWTLLPTWIRQIGGDAARKDVVKGIACAVTDDAKDVYLAGIIENGGSFSAYDQQSFGKDDVFLFQASAEDGSIKFLRQLGTSGDERLSPGGLTTDEFGNAILMGNTDGSLYRPRRFDQESENTDDLFIMTVMRETGDYKEPEVLDTSASTTPDETEVQQGVIITPIARPRPADQEEEPETTFGAQEPAEEEEETSEDNGTEEEEEESIFESEPATVQDTAASVKPAGEQPHIFEASGVVENNNFKQEDEQPPANLPSRQRYGLIIFFILVVIVGLISGLFAYRHMTRGEATTDRDKVTEYLHEFDVDDIDLKQSATGGYHCSYTNDLAHGINARAVSREGLFGPMGFSGKASTNDPLLRVHSRDPRAGGEIHFSHADDGDSGIIDRDDISSIGSGVATPGRHSTHNEPLLADDHSKPANDMVI